MRRYHIPRHLDLERKNRNNSIRGHERGLPSDTVGTGVAIQHGRGLPGVSVCASMARRLDLPALWQPGGQGDPAGPVAMPQLPVRGFGHGRHNLPRHALVPQDLVSRYVACNQPEDGCQRVGTAASLGCGQLQDRLGDAAQDEARHGPSGTGTPAGVVEVDETYWGAEESGVVGRLTEEKTIIIVGAEEDGRGIGRIRLRQIPDLTKASLHGFVLQSVEPGSTVRTDGLNAYLGLKGYVHDRRVQRRQAKGEYLLPRVHRVVSLLKRWLLGTHQGAIGSTISTTTSTSSRFDSTGANPSRGGSFSTA